MSGNDLDKNRDQIGNVTRRSLLKKASIASVVGTTGVITIPEIATAANPCNLGGSVEWDKSYRDTKRPSRGGYDYFLDHSIGLEYYGSDLNTSGNYQHEFRINTQAYGRARQSNTSGWNKIRHGLVGIGHQELTIDASSLNFQSLLVGNDACNIGCTPPASAVQANPDYSTIVTSAASLALSRVHPAIGGSIGVGQILNALRKTQNSSAGGNIQNKTWNYPSGKIRYDTSYYYRWFLEQRDSCRRSRFNLRSEATSPECGASTITDNISLQQPTDPGLCGSISNMKEVEFNERLAALNEQYDVKKYPDHIVEADPRLREFADGGPVYRVVLPIHSESAE